jgi:tetratricopeptide (TPR) repeat protein
MTIKKLHDNLYDEKTSRNSRMFIDSYEANIDLINSVDLSNLTDYDFAMRLTCDYAILLEKAGNLKKSIPYFDKAIKMLENFPDFQENKFFDIQYYELTMFHKARALYNLKKYKDSQLIFDGLNKAFPNNDKYQSWIIGIKSKKYDFLIWTGMGVILTLLILRTFLEGKYTLFNKLSFWTLLFVLIFTAVLGIVKQIVIRKQKKKNAT